MDTKQCTKCKETLGIEAFDKNRKAADGHPAQCKACRKKHAQANKEHIAAYQKEYSKINKAQLSEYRKEYKKVNKEKALAYNKERYQNNKERLRAQMNEYKRANPDKFIALKAKRRAAKLQRTPKWLTADDHAKINFYYTEAKRLEKETGIKYHVDHIIPMQGDLVSGLHVPSNLQVITAAENLAKNNTFVV
jgi:exonuclease VII large subunit